MAPPPNIVQWVNKTFPRPRIDLEWLDGCCNWITAEKQLDPVTNSNEFIRQVENQLLGSDLRDSMIRETGLPLNSRDLKKGRFGGPQPILVEVTALTEIGHSAFSLSNVRQARLEREDLAGLVQREREMQGQEVAEGAEDEGPIPKYPRSMLMMEISDGSVTMPAIEYRKLPQLELGESPLGYKIMLKDVLVRNGTAFLEPNGVIMKGFNCHERDEFRDVDFLRSLNKRMGRPNPPEAGNNDQGTVVVASPPRSAGEVPSQSQRKLPKPEPRDITMESGEEDTKSQQRNRPLPANVSSSNAINGRNEPSAASLPSSEVTLVASRYFGGSTIRPSEASLTQTLTRYLSPARGAHNFEPIDIDDNSSDSFPATAIASSSSVVQPQPSSSVLSRGQGVTATTSLSLSSPSGQDEYDFGSDIVDEAFLQEVDMAERAAVGATTLLKAEPASRSTSVTTQPVARIQTHRLPTVRHEIITIDDDWDDKENKPVSKRRVRRRVDEQTPIEVIDLSD